MPAPKGNQFAKGNRGGGVPIYDARFSPVIARNAARSGMTREQIAVELRVTVKTLQRWEKKYPAFREGLNTSKDGADGEVVDSLYRRAMGYDLTQTEIKQEKDETGKLIKTVAIQKKVHIPPDPTSMIFWLKNRQRDKWRDKRETEVSGPGGGPIEHKAVQSRPVELSEQELLALRALRAKVASQSNGN